MYDRPTAGELIEAARMHLEQNIVPVARGTDRKLYFQTLVAVNVLKIVERELLHHDDHQLAAWERLNAIQGDQPLPSPPQSLGAALAERTARLCEAIRAGQHDDDPQVFAHLKATTRAQLAVANPKFLNMLAQEDTARA